MNFKSSFGILVFALSIFAAQAAHAATLYFGPSSGNFSVGNILTTSVFVNTEGQAINNADSVINFPTELLDVVSVSKTGSIFSLWVEEPTFSNGTGSISFNGGLPTPGFNGTAGKVVSIVFRTKSAGTASVIFSSGAVRANDGFGTDVLTTRTPAQFTLAAVEPPRPPVAGAPTASTISSPTHPDSNTWYPLNTARFSWNLPSDVTGTRLLITRIPDAAPTVTYIPPISVREIENLDDGIWYFSTQLRNADGWGTIARIRIQIDTEKPSRFEITEVKREDITDPRVQFIFDAKDETSGIDYYEVQVGNENPRVWRDEGSARYELPVLASGKYTLIAKAVDKAGNALADSAEFVIEPLEAPIITDYPQELASGEILILKGTTQYPDADVNIFLQREKDEPKSYLVKTDKDGKFTFVAQERPAAGIYTAWAEVRDARGAVSTPSKKVTIATERLAILRIGEVAISFLAVIVPLIALLLLLVYLAWHWWHKFAAMRKRVKKEVREVEHALHRAFDLLKETIREQIKMLEKTRSKRELTEEEEKTIKKLKKDLDDAEKLVRKEIEDIEREVK